jgi:hypothetical protein
MFAAAAATKQCEMHDQRHFSSSFRDMGESGLSLERFAQSSSVNPLTPGQAVGSDLPL